MIKKEGMNKVRLKIEVVMPYGGNIGTYMLSNIPLIKRNINNSVFTVNRSPHGNKTAREQFSIGGSKYTTIVKLNTIGNVDNMMRYIGGIGTVQGINHTQVRYVVGYKLKHSMRV